MSAVHGHWSSCLPVFSLKLLVNQIAVSLGETFPGPNGFSKTPSSSYLSSCINLALNSSNPSKASARCRCDEVSNRRRRKSDEAWLDAPAVAFWSEQLPASSPSTSNMVPWVTGQALVKLSLARALSQTWIVHLSFVIEWSPIMELEEPCAEVDEVFGTGKKGLSYEANGNSAILSIRGALTETSGEFMWWRRPILDLQADSLTVDLLGNGRDALRAAGADFFTGVCEARNCKQRHTRCRNFNHNIWWK